MALFKDKTVPVREKRLNTLSAYLGTSTAVLAEIHKEDDVKQRIRTFSEARADDLTVALKLFSRLKDCGIVVHGPRGCAAGLLYFGQKTANHHWTVSNLVERDTIMGGEESLREAILALHKHYSLELVIVLTTPSVAINNDDVYSVCAELQRELKMKIVPVYTDGFKSRTEFTGYDAAFYSLLKSLPIESKNEKKSRINLLSVGEDKRDIKEIGRLLDDLNINFQILPQQNDLQELLDSAQSVASAALNKDESDFLGRALQDFYQVKYLTAQPPIGLEGTYQWLLAIGKVFGKEAQVSTLHSSETSRLKTIVANRSLQGKKVYINLSAALALAVRDLVKELGGTVVGITVDQVDSADEPEWSRLQQEQADLSIHVASGQIFEQVNLWRKLEPDLFIGRASSTAWAAKQGILAIAIDQLPLFGYQGIIEFDRQIRKIFMNSSFIKKLAQSARLPYKEAWYAKRADWHIKVEVK